MPGFEDYLREDYGSGVYRRHITIRVESENSVYAALEDEAHAFELRLILEGSKVVDIQPQWHRHPLSSCINAAEALDDVIGFEISDNPLALPQYADSIENCTHFFDLLNLMCTHASRIADKSDYPNEFHYQAAVTDEIASKNIATLEQNGQEVLRWNMEAGIIKKSGVFDEVAALKGLTRWCREHLDDLATEQALILQKAVFVSRARMIRTEDMAGIRLVDTPQPVGVCYATRDNRELRATRTGTRKDQSDGTELLKFVT